MHHLKIFIIVAFLAAVQGYSIKQKETAPEIVAYAGIGDLINSTIEGIRPNIPDPLTINDIALEISEGPLIGGLKVNKLQVSGLQGFQIPVLAIDVLKLSANFVFNLPELNIDASYWLDLLLLDLIPLYGDGIIKVNLEDFAFTGSGALDLSNGLTHLQIKDVVVVIALGNATFDLHGILLDENLSLLLSKVLSDAVISFINDHQQLISNILSPIAQSVINSLLNSILGGGDNPELVALVEQIYAEHLAAVQKINSA